MDSTVNLELQSTEAMYVLDAMQRRLTDLREVEQTDPFEASCVELAATILERAEARLRSALYPQEPLFPFDDFPATLTVAAFATEDPTVVWHYDLDR